MSKQEGWMRRVEVVVVVVGVLVIALAYTFHRACPLHNGGPAIEFVFELLLRAL